jgi:hypothetical protein
MKIILTLRVFNLLEILWGCLWILLGIFEGNLSFWIERRIWGERRELWKRAESNENKRTKERKNEKTKERKNERTKERKNKRTKERKNERTKERKNKIPPKFRPLPAKQSITKVQPKKIAPSVIYVYFFICLSGGMMETNYVWLILEQ